MLNKKFLAIPIIILLVALLFVFMPKKSPMQEINENETAAPKIDAHGEKIISESNKSIPAESKKIIESESSKKEITGGSSGGGSEKSEDSNQLPGLQPCPSSLGVEYLIDYKQTVTPTDDDVYLGVRNNNQLPEFIEITVDDYNEGTLQINGLGLSVIKSLQITSWWRPLNIAAQKTFTVLLEPESCMPITTLVTVTFPPTEGDYLD